MKRMIIPYILLAIAIIVIGLLASKLHQEKNKKITLSNLDSSIYPEKIEKITEMDNQQNTTSLRIGQDFYLVTYKIPRGFQFGDPYGTGGQLTEFIANHRYQTGYWPVNGSIESFKEPKLMY